MEFQIGQIFEGEYPPEAAVWCNENGAYIEAREDGYVIVAIREPTLEEAKAGKLTEINAACDAAIAALTASYPESELRTFDKQEAEARALLADPATSAPLLTQLAAERGISVLELAQRVQKKADAFTVASGCIIGQRQKYKDVLDAARTAEDARAVVPAYAMPAVQTLRG